MRVMRMPKKYGKYLKEKIEVICSCLDLYVQSDTLFLADVFENFRNMCLEVYGLDSIYFVSAPRLAWQACLKKTSKIRINNRL